MTRATTRRLAAALAAVALTTVAACGAAPTPPPPAPDAAASRAAEQTTGQVAGQAATRAPELTRDDVDAWLDGLLPTALEREGIAGATVAVVHDGEVVTTRGYGWADVEQQVPVDPDRTLFRVGSVSKVFTATAVMQLVEQGELDLDADVRDRLDFDLPTRYDTPVTLRHLLTHTAGFEERVEGLIGPPGADVDLRDAMADDPPEQVYEPGTVPAYSNYGNSLAGYLVELASGQPFEEYVAEHVLAPAGMASSTFAQPLPADLAERMSRGYTDDTAQPTPFETVGTPPAGALTSSATDMARFMLAQLGRSEGEPLLRPETLEQQHAPALGEDSLGTLAAGPRMTLGFFDRSRNGHRIVEHGGDTDVFHSDLELYPDDGTGVFVSFNSSGTEGDATIVLRDQVLGEFADRYYPGEPAATVGTDADEARDQAATVAGGYASSRTVRSNFLSAAYAIGQTTITAQDDGRLLLSPGTSGQPSESYEPVGPWTWRQVGGDRVIAARVADGQVEALGVDNAFALLPVPIERSQGVLLPVVGGSALVLLLGSVGWLLARPVQWVRRRRGTAQRPPREGRTLRVLTRAGVAAAALALVGWGILVTTVMGLGTPTTASIRTVQALQLVGLVAVVPAVLLLVQQVRRRAGWARVLATGLVVAALVGTGWAAVTLRLVSPDITY